MITCYSLSNKLKQLRKDILKFILKKGSGKIANTLGKIENYFKPDKTQICTIKLCYY